METARAHLEARINVLQTVLTDDLQQQAVANSIRETNGDWLAARARLRDISPAMLAQLDLAHALALWSNDDLPLVRAISKLGPIASLRDLALNANVEKLTALIETAHGRPARAGEGRAQERSNRARELHTKLFHAEPSAVLQRMLQDADIPIADTAHRAAVASFLGNQPGFNIRNTSIYSALKHPQAFNGIADADRSVVVEHLKTLQRVQAISPVPEAVPVLMRAKLTSAFSVAAMPEATFLRAQGAALGDDVARQVHANALSSQIRNEHALAAMRETVRGSGLAIIDGPDNRQQRVQNAQRVADRSGVPLDLETLFGGIDHCACDDCLSVYSPASYFVELLQFLRNNDLGNNPAAPGGAPADNPHIKKGIADTPLEKLFRRRPDLGCLELTCKNTFTVLPYIDLATEVMESFVVHTGAYHADKNVPKQATLETFNVEDESSGELLAQPQHVNYLAYCILKGAVYPFTLPYHQPIDESRIFLDYLGASRWQLQDTFRSADAFYPQSPLTPAQKIAVKALHQAAIERAVDAEFLGMTQEEYIILTHQAFWPREYFDVTQQLAHTDAEYRQKIGVRPLHDYYGYPAEADMLSLDEDPVKGQQGLTFVKEQFLPRTGIAYADLVSLLTTRFINPNFPQGKALTLLDSIRFSYRFLQTLVDPASSEPKQRFAKLVSFLNAAQPLVPKLESMLHPDPCKAEQPGWHVSEQELQEWVHCYFERIGQLIVLESGDTARLSIDGQVVTRSATGAITAIGTLHPDGTIVDTRGAVIGNVTPNGQVLATDGEAFAAKYPNPLEIIDREGVPIGFIIRTGIFNNREVRATWQGGRDTCDLDKVRLAHLDGSALHADDYDRMQRFIRLWRKVGWTMEETDKALTGSAIAAPAVGIGNAPAPAGPEQAEQAGYVGFDTFDDNCMLGSLDPGDIIDPAPATGQPLSCPAPLAFKDSITPAFLHQLRAVKQLADRTGLALPKLLSFWADIGTDGDTSLYASLFLTHHIRSMDKVFQADGNGNYLTQAARITDHLPVLMAAFRLREDDILAIVSSAKLADALTLGNLSTLYRYSLLARILHVRVALLQDVIDLFGDPFSTPWAALDLIENWGKMEEAGVGFHQLDYVILGRDYPAQAVAPSRTTSLRLAKALHEGLIGLDLAHPDIATEDGATAALIRAKASLLFDPAQVDRIVGLLEGTSSYVTNAPVDVDIKAGLLGTRFRYSYQADPLAPTVSLMVTGILSDAALEQALALCGDPAWASAIDAIALQAHAVFDSLPAGLFADPAAARAALLRPDFNDPSSPLNPPLASNPPNTAPQKRFYFLQSLLAFTNDPLVITNEADATSELVLAKVGATFAEPLRQQIMGLLEGTAVYSASQQAAGANLTILPLLGAKLTYRIQGDSNPLKATLTATGILTSEERAQALALSDHPAWVKAVDRLAAQAARFFDDTLSALFPPPDPAQGASKNLLAGDVNAPGNPQNPAQAPNPANTAPQKRLYFASQFLPILRARLARRLIVETLAGATGMDVAVTEALLTDVLVVGSPPVPALAALQEIKAGGVPASQWSGYLIPASDAAYAFSAIGEAKQPDDIVIDGQHIAFSIQQSDPDNVYFTAPVALKAGKLYFLEVSDRDAGALAWRTPASALAPLPPACLLPDYVSAGATEVFAKLTKAALLVNAFTLNAAEVRYLQLHGTDFANFDFNALTVHQWKRLLSYADLRDSLPAGEGTLLELFAWAGAANDPAALDAKIAALTSWKSADIGRLIAPEHFDLRRLDAFRNEINLLKLRDALAVAGKIGVDIGRLFAWARPGSKFWACRQVADDIRQATRARFDQQDWEQIVKPLNDRLRENQKRALIAYLLVQQDVVDWGVRDADGLFEFFLIDVQMDACMQTSRIKQAISSVQLFIQRCLLGLEERTVAFKEVGVPNHAIDRGRWEWMQRYRVWEANRKVFLYPENWIVPELRDDKSDFYKELESELLQKDVNSETVQDALKSYLFKLDEVANLKVVGLNVELIDPHDIASDYRKLHVFARTRNAPYVFFYRWYDNAQGNWYPWQKMQVDIPSYELEDANGQAVSHGTYLIPVTWNNRLLVFFPQFTKKSAAADVQLFSSIKVPDDKNKPDGPFTMKKTVFPGKLSPKDMSAMPLDKAMNAETWEIKLCWSELRNGKWTPKQLSKDAVYDFDAVQKELPFADITLSSYQLIYGYDITSRALSNITKYHFVPEIVTAGPKGIRVHVERPGFKGIFTFSGSRMSKAEFSAGPSTILDGLITDFHYAGKSIYSYQTVDNSAPMLAINNTVHVDEEANAGITVTQKNIPAKFDHPFADELLGQLNTGTLDDLFAYWKQVGDKGNTYGADQTATYHELKAPYALYNWEAAFHAPMLLVDRLLNSQKFEQALRLCQYVLDPFAGGNAADTKRFWRFLPFREIEPDKVLENLFLGLQAGQANAQINEWRNNPFAPHLIARSRPAAYMKWVAMTYLKVLIAWGDYLFRQDTIETNNQAAQLYVLAAHVYGPRTQKIPRRGKTQAATYNGLLDQWDAFGNAMVELELAFPFSNQASTSLGSSNGVTGLANVFGFASTLYFCIPDNPQLAALRDTIDDRLFKLRNCENIDGVFRQQPLFEPAIDPALLVQATAQGLNLSNVVNELNSPMPNYRFYYLLQKAQEVCGELKALGNAFLAAKEKGDGEALSRLRATHESGIQKLLLEVKTLQLAESESAVEALQQSRKGPVYRLQHYLKLLGEDASRVPDEQSDFGELPEQIEQPVDETGLKLSNYEKEEMDKASEAAALQVAIGVSESLAGILYSLPTIHTAAHPLGVGVDIVIGGENGAKAIQAYARGAHVYADNVSYQSTSAARKSGFLRQMQERTQQANNAGYEIKNIDRQILTQKIRIDMAQRDIGNQERQIENAQEAQDFLADKYTNQQLYSWMESQVRTLYYQAYTLAFDLAKRAEKAFRFERGLSESNFIEFGYWDAGHDGLLAGERLYLALKQLEAAHQEKRGYDFEIVKNVSIQQLNPLALMQLRETGSCELTLPEVLFDMGYPGHYMRRIKSVALTIACHVGPPTSMNCVLRLLEHKFRTKPSVAAAYAEKTDENDDRFSTTNVPVNAIAVSTGQNDSGVFELNFHDERYIPFEGAGVVSKWRIELPAAFREFDYQTITEVLMQVRYTALDGGEKLKAAAAKSVKAYVKNAADLGEHEGLFAVFDLAHDFPNEWYKSHAAPAGPARTIVLDGLRARLPAFTNGLKADDIQANDIYLFTPSEATASLTVPGKGEINSFGPSPAVGKMHALANRNVHCPMNNWILTVTQDDGSSGAVEACWLVIRYTVKLA